MRSARWNAKNVVHLGLLAEDLSAVIATNATPQPQIV
jgi:hypothetical protein